MSTNTNPVLHAVRHLSHRYDEVGDKIADFNRRQADGEHPDPNEFVDLLKKQSVVHSALGAQYSMLQRPLRAVLNETK